MTVESLLSVLAALWPIAPVRWATYLVGVMFLLVYVMGKIKRYKKKEDPPLWVKVGEVPVGVLIWLGSVTVNFTIGWLWGAPTTITFTERLEDILDNPKFDNTFRGALARKIASAINALWLGHVEV